MGHISTAWLVRRPLGASPAFTFIGRIGAVDAGKRVLGACCLSLDPCPSHIMALG